MGNPVDCFHPVEGEMALDFVKKKEEVVRRALESVMDLVKKKEDVMCLAVSANIAGDESVLSLLNTDRLSVIVRPDIEILYLDGVGIVEFYPVKTEIIKEHGLRRFRATQSYKILRGRG